MKLILIYLSIALLLLLSVTNVPARIPFELELQEAVRIHELDVMVQEDPLRAVTELLVALDTGLPTLQMVAAHYSGRIGGPEAIQGLERTLGHEMTVPRVKQVIRVARQHALLADRPRTERQAALRQLTSDPQWARSQAEILIATDDASGLEQYRPAVRSLPVVHYLHMRSALVHLGSAERIQELTVRLQASLTKPNEAVAICALLVDEGVAVVHPMLALLDSIEDKRSILVNHIADILISIGSKEALPALQSLASNPDPSISSKILGHLPWLEAGVRFPYRYKRVQFVQARTPDRGGRRRLHSSLGNVSPDAYEQAYERTQL